ncbi:DUF3987 domain-containing protein [Pararhizobium haloflavum]|uniref:DUF3987 domain-containing protein n=1 Tax=Pararhizobium haloflavum TaxID=2037914 RepID=UPI000C180650|nr:DUF3987 domain-containing protein [Pararhizobium haloflavum]
MAIDPPDDFASAAKWANSYRSLNLAVIPAENQEKIPLGKWREFQSGIPQAVHDRWYGNQGEHLRNYRMGFLTGAASLGNGCKLLVIDLDEKGSASGSLTWDSWIADNELGCDLETWRARTGGGGQHIYFRYPAHLAIRNTQKTIAGIDVRAEGGFVVAPPSLHQSGKPYRWLFSPFETELADAPEWLLERVGASEKPMPAATRATTESSPSEQITDAWGHIVDGRDAYMRDIVWAAIVDWYRECPIPPSECEIERKMLESYAVYERKVRPQDGANTLEAEGRGLTAFKAKWAYAMRQWDSKVATAAKAKSAGRAANDGTAVIATPAHIDDPVDLWAKLAPPPLPTGILPRQIEAFAFGQAEQMGADPAGLAMAALAVCAAAIPDRVRIKVKRHGHWYENARLWTALIGTPSTKKSPIINQAVRPITRLDGRLVRSYLANKDRYDSLTKDDRKEEEPPEHKRLRIEDTTIEAAQIVLADSPDGVLLVQDELSGWFGAMDKYNSGGRGAAKDRAFWLQSFNGGQYVVDRVTRGVTMIDNLSVSILGGIQPEAIATVARETVDDGLLQRLLPVVLKRASVGKDAPLPGVTDHYETLVEKLNAISISGTASFGASRADAECLTLYFSDDALRIREELEERHLALMDIEGINRKLASHVGKYDGIFARLSVIWHAILNINCGVIPPEVSVGTAERVAAFLHQFLLPHAASFYSGIIGMSDDQDELQSTASYILTNRPDVMTVRDCQRGSRVMRAMTRQQIQRVMEQMESLGWVEPIAPPKNSVTLRWAINPRVHDLFANRAVDETRRRQGLRDVANQIFGRDQ